MSVGWHSKISVILTQLRTVSLFFASSCQHSWASSCSLSLVHDNTIAHRLALFRFVMPIQLRFVLLSFASLRMPEHHLGSLRHPLWPAGCAFEFARLMRGTVSRPLSAACKFEFGCQDALQTASARTGPDALQKTTSARDEVLCAAATSSLRPDEVITPEVVGIGAIKICRWKRKKRKERPAS